MKKIKKVFILSVLLFIACKKPVYRLKIDNQSDWDIVVNITNLKELGTYQKFSNYLIPKRDTCYFDILHNGTCKLLSVNGAKIHFSDKSSMILTNDEPVEIKVINKTAKNFLLYNVPLLPVPLCEYYVKHYRPNFSNVNISDSDTESNPKVLKIYGWQIKQCKNERELNSLAIGFKANIPNIKFSFKTKNNSIYLICD